MRKSRMYLQRSVCWIAAMFLMADAAFANFWFLGAPMSASTYQSDSLVLGMGYVSGPLPIIAPADFKFGSPNPITGVMFWEGSGNALVLPYPFPGDPILGGIWTCPLAAPMGGWFKTPKPVMLGVPFPGDHTAAVIGPFNTSESTGIFVF